MTHNSEPEVNFEKINPLHFRYFHKDFKYSKNFFCKPSLVAINRPERFLFQNLPTQIRLRSCVGGSDFRYVGVLLSVLSHGTIFEVIWVLLLILRFISVGYH